KILASEGDQHLKQGRAIRGVTGVENRLEAHEQAGGVSSLQGGAPHHGETSELMQSNWSPAVRFLAGICGGALTLYGARRKDVFSAAVGLGLVTRSLTNMGGEGLIGLDGGYGNTVRRNMTNDEAGSRGIGVWRQLEN